MKAIYNYRFYLSISLITMLINGLLSMLRVNINSEKFATIAFIFFSIAVVMVAVGEFMSLRPNFVKKLKSLSRIWKK